MLPTRLVFRAAARVAIAATFTAIAATTIHAQRIAVPDGVSALRTAYVAAYNSGDAESMNDLYVDASVRMPYDGVEQAGRAAIVAGYKQTFAARKLVPTLRLDAEDILVDGARAVERGRYHERLVPPGGGAAFVEDGKYVSVLERGSDGRWRYVWSIFNRDAPARREGKAH